MNLKVAPDNNLIQRLLDALTDDILPLTEQGVKRGNKIFGAALLTKSDYNTYLAETNNEIESPLHHGEMHLLKRYFEIPASERLPASELIFLSTHEPCSMCLSAITWSGFDNFFYFFSHEDSRDEFDIPHDLNILNEVFGLKPGQYNKQNEFWHCHNIVAWIEQSAPDTIRDSHLASIQAIKKRYSAASTAYQTEKSDNDIPLN